MTVKYLNDKHYVGGGSSSSSDAIPYSMEQRWKWVKNDCWNNAGLRNQNQCNDKWNNLLRDYKKVCNYEARAMTFTADSIARDRPSYWVMKQHEQNSKCKSMRRGDGQDGRCWQR
ncbi:putative trihelix transcription factor ASR3 [Cocos nucifera]|uniref:Putative trihelix transcription factor ASR3 n=1 Tax=Cocos nucifera TaxID=13894 RepID=A0A8K0I2L8_COCNU|nr:putative trihelix transcription factor ASR3 [Cocos nucifera]